MQHILPKKKTQKEKNKIRTERQPGQKNSLSKGITGQRKPIVKTKKSKSHKAIQ
jgi:hypothetical protein